MVFLPAVFPIFGAAVFVATAVGLIAAAVEPLAIAAGFVGGGLGWLWFSRRIFTEVQLDADVVRFISGRRQITVAAHDISALEAPPFDLNRSGYINVRVDGSAGPLRIARLRHLVDLVTRLRQLNPALIAPNIFSTAELLAWQPPEVITEVLAQQRRDREP